MNEYNLVVTMYEEKKIIKVSVFNCETCTLGEVSVFRLKLKDLSNFSESYLGTNKTDFSLELYENNRKLIAHVGQALVFDLVKDNDMVEIFVRGNVYVRVDDNLFCRRVLSDLDETYGILSHSLLYKVDEAGKYYARYTENPIDDSCLDNDRIDIHNHYERQLYFKYTD